MFICVSVVKFHITKKHPNYWEIKKIVTFIKFYNVYPERGDVVLCQTCEAVYGELKCAGFFALSICGVVL